MNRAGFLGATALAALLAACADEARAPDEGQATAAAPASAPRGAVAESAADLSVQWPGYNRTLTSERFVPLAEITPQNVASLDEVCSYDTGLTTSFQTGPIVVDDVMVFTSEFETFAIGAGDCEERWRVAHDYEAISPLAVNRGAAYLDGRLFRGTQDGQLLALDASTGETLWSVQLGIEKKGETTPAAPIAWNGKVFIGNAGGDNYGVKGRIYAFDAATGEALWETYLVPSATVADAEPASIVSAARVNEVADAFGQTWETGEEEAITGGATWTSYTLDPGANGGRGLLYVPAGNPAPDFIPEMRTGENLLTNTITVLDAQTGAYVRHHSLVPADFHDWDASAAPAVITTRGGRRIVASVVKDGILRAHDDEGGERLYEVPVTTQFNVTAPLTQEGTRFCPGSQGGAEWNTAAYSPDTNMLYTGTVDWCTTVRVKTIEEAASVSMGQPWSGSADEENVFGEFDPKEEGRGWVYAVDADTGEVAWRWEAPTPILAHLTPTAGGVVFTGDLNGVMHAFDAGDGTELARWQVGGPIGGGLISYETGGRQVVAVTSGMNAAIWPWEGGTAKVTVYGLPG